MLDRIKRETESYRQGNNDPEHLHTQDWVNDVDFTAGSLQFSNSPRVRNRVQAQEVEAEPGTIHQQSSQPADDQNQPQYESPPKNTFTTKHSSTPNTPTSLYQRTAQQRPRTFRGHDSQDLLRKLARRESHSPTYTNTPEHRAVDDTISNMKTPVVMGAWIDTPAPERQTDSGPPQEESHSESEAADSTPVQVKRQPPAVKTEPHPQPPSPRQVKVNSRPFRRTHIPLEKPDLPKSALEAVIRDAKAGQDQSLVIGENTIDSLQGLLDDDLGLPSLKGAGVLDKGSSDSDADTTTNANSVTLPATDEAVIDRLNGKLLSLVRNIKEVRSGLSGLETQAAKDATLLATSGTKSGKRSHSCPKNKTCEVCGLAGDGRLYISFPIPRLWHRRPESNRIRPTLAGWTIGTLLSWYLLESALCEIYCNPIYLSTGIERTIDPNAPRMPWVLPTMLWRWSHLSPILTPIWALLVAFFRLVAQIFGFWDGFVDRPISVPSSRSRVPPMDDMARGQLLARRGYVPPYEPPPQVHPTVVAAAAGGAWQAPGGHDDQDLSMERDEIL
jgi:hypothetical protein